MCPYCLPWHVSPIVCTDLSQNYRFYHVHYTHKSVSNIKVYRQYQSHETSLGTFYKLKDPQFATLSTVSSMLCLKLY